MTVLDIAQPHLDEEMLWVSGGTAHMGSNAHYPEEVPTHLVTVDGFWTAHRSRPRDEL
jgi:formylglycine-generating enzyme required for sulfatase activity